MPESLSSFARSAAIPVFAVMLLASTPPVSAAAPTRAERLDRIMAQLEQAMERSHVPGFSLAIVADGAVVLAEGRGVRDVESKRPADAETLYPMGSMTKGFTATVLGMLVDEGAAAWDDPVRDHLPGLALRDEEATAAVTLRDLLCHRTGLMGMDLLWYAGTASWDDIVPCVARAEATAPLGARFQFNNPLFAAAGRAAARAAGTATWEDLLRRRLLAPLEMSDTTASFAAAEGDPRLARGYAWQVGEPDMRGEPGPPSWVELPRRNADAVAAAAGMTSNARDLAQWVRLLLGHGRFDGRRLVSSESCEATWTPQIEPMPGRGYGLGWYVHEWGGRRLVEHGGNIGGFSTQIAVLPDDGVGFVILANRAATPLTALAIDVVFDGLLGEWTTDDAGADGANERYLGRYRFDAMDTDLTVVLRNGRLAVDVPGQMVYETSPPDETGRRRFRGFDHIAIEFVEDGAGAVVAMKLFQAGLEFELPRQGVEPPPAMAASDLAPFPGTYRDDADGMTVDVVVQGGRLAVDVPGQMVFDLHPPDDAGTWRFRAVPDVSVSFERDGAGAVVALVLRQGIEERRLGREGAGPGAEPLPSPAELMERLHVAGGAEQFVRTENMRMRGTVEFVNQGVTGELDLMLAGFDRMRRRLELGPFGWIQTSCVGYYAWHHSSFEPFRRLSSAMRDQFQNQHPAALYDFWQSRWTRMRTLGRDEVDGVETFVVELARDDLPTMWVHLGVRDALPRRIEGASRVEGPGGTGEIPGVVTFDDYRMVAGGVQLPFRIVSEDPVNGRVVTRIEQFEHDFELNYSPWDMTPDGDEESPP